MREETNKDSILCTIINFVKNGWPKKISNINLKPYFLCKTQLAYEDGCLMRGHKIVLPKSLQSRILSELHKSHLGMVKTKADARARVWFPGIDTAIESMINSCDICNQLRSSPPRVSISPWKYPAVPFYRIHLDFLGPLNNRMYLVIVDAYTKWVEVYDVPSTTSNVVEKLYEYISRFGLPHTIVTDNATNFSSEEFRAFCLQNGIIHIFSPPYHPASNGQAESYVKIVKRGIKSSLMSSKNYRECKIKLLKYLYDYRNSIHSTTQLSPAQLVFGRTLRSHLDLISNNSPAPSSTLLNEIVRNKQCTQIKAQGGKIMHNFPNGTNVLYKRYLNNNKYIWRKGTIVNRIGKVMYLVKDIETSITLKKHKNQLICYHRIFQSNNNNQWCHWDGDIGADLLRESHQSNTNSSTREEEEARRSLRRSESEPALQDTPAAAVQPAGQPSTVLPHIERGNPTSRIQLRPLPNINYRRVP